MAENVNRIVESAISSSRPDDEVAAELEPLLGLGPEGTLEMVLVARRGWVDVDPQTLKTPPPGSDTISRPTGQEIFESKSRAEQDEMVGPKAAELLRAGKIRMEDLRDTSRLKQGDNFITQKPAQDLEPDS